MLYPFSKYTGCGNDFILFDNRALTFPTHVPRLMSQLCHRQKGIGADGVILLEHSSSANFRMRIFNSDGSEAEMCGNGVRCLFKFIQKIGIKGEQFYIETLAGLLKVHHEKDDVAIEIGSPKNVQWSIPFASWTLHHLDTGVPHTVIFLDDIESLKLQECGAKIRFDSLFAPRGTNVNFAKIHQSFIELRTYERGVENETLACGTGVTATALAAAKIYQIKTPIHVKVRSGDMLKVDFQLLDDGFVDVRLVGSAHFVFAGTVDLTTFSTGSI